MRDGLVVLPLKIDEVDTAAMLVAGGLLAPHDAHDRLAEESKNYPADDSHLTDKRRFWPDVVTIADVVGATISSDFACYLQDRRNARKIPHRFEACGYVPVRNPYAEDGLWAINKRRQVIYGRTCLSEAARHAAVGAYLKANQ